MRKLAALVIPGLLLVTALPAAAVTGRGLEFWGAWPRSHASLETSAVLVVMADEPADVAVDGAFTASGTASPGSPWIVPVPATLRTAVDRVPSDVGFRVASVDGTTPVTVLFRVPEQAEASDDVARLLPTSELGTRYIVTGYASIIPVAPSYFMIIATEDATSVTTTTACGGDPAGPVMLDAGQALQVFCRYDDTPPDITGSIIDADKPVAVLAGASSAWVPSDRLSGDFLVEAMTPVSAWGTEFYTAPLPKGDDPLDGFDILRVTASSAGEVTVDDGVSPQTVPLAGPGDWLEIQTPAALRITATVPVDVQLFATGVESSDIGDPFMATVPPTSDWPAAGRVYLPPDYTLGSFLNLVTPLADTSSVRHGGQAVTGWTVLPGGSHAWARVDLGLFSGPRLVTSASTISVLAYGFNDAYQPDPDLGAVPGSYGYPAPSAMPACRIEVEAAAPATACPGQIVRLEETSTQTVGCAEVEYRWLVDGQPVPGCGFSPVSSCDALFEGPAEYVLEARCAANPTGCATGIAVAQIEEGTGEEITLQPDPAEVCEGDSLLLQAGSGFDSYEWTSVPPDPGVTPQTTVAPELEVDPEVDTVYSVVARGAGACDSTDDLEVVVVPDPVPTFLGNVLRVRLVPNGDLTLSWTDLPTAPVTGYEPVGLACASRASCPAPTPSAMDQGTSLAAAALPGVESLAVSGLPAGDLVFLQMRALSPCSASPGPTCDGFPAQVPCP